MHQTIGLSMSTDKVILSQLWLITMRTYLTVTLDKVNLICDDFYFIKTLKNKP